MSSLKDMSPEELAALAGDGTPDIPASAANSITLLQPGSPQLSLGSDGYVEDAAVGDFVHFAGGKIVVTDGSTGISFVPVGFELSWPEYLPNRGGFVTNHAEKPANAVWQKAVERPDGKAGLFLPNGNHVEQTITVFMMIIPDEDEIEPYGATFAFRSASLAVGREFSNKASRAKVTINGVELVGPTIASWRLSSRSEAKGAHRWQAPFVIPVGKLGEARGPTLDQVRQAAQLRHDFKTVKLRSNAKAAPALGVRDDLGGRDDMFDNDNGFGPPAPPPASYDGPDDDYTF